MPTQRLNFIFLKSFIASSLILIFFVWADSFYRVNRLSGPSHSGLPMWNGSPFVLKNRIWFLVYFSAVFLISPISTIFKPPLLFFFPSPNQLKKSFWQFWWFSITFHRDSSGFSSKISISPVSTLLLANPFSSYHFHGFHLFTRGFKIYFLWWQSWQEIQTKELE